MTEVIAINSGLKSITKTALDGYKLVFKAVKKEPYVKELSLVIAGIAAVIDSIPTLSQEVTDLQKLENEIDLVEFVISQVNQVTDNPKAVKIASVSIKMAAHLISDSIALAKAIQS